MRPSSPVWLAAVFFVLTSTLIPSVGVFAQQATGAPEASPPPQELDQLTAPIALYPDVLVFQIVGASTDFEALQSFGAWLEKNAALKGTELQDAAQKAGFGEACIALAPFPQVVQMMVQKPDWTKALGKARRQKAVFDSIQRLRAQAQAAGNLKNTSQQKVETQTTSSGDQVIVIQPANPQVIYVPTYNPQVVYVQAAPAELAYRWRGAGGLHRGGDRRLQQQLLSSLRQLLGRSGRLLRGPPGERAGEPGSAPVQLPGEPG